MENMQQMSFSVYGGECQETPSLVESNNKTGYVRAGTNNLYFEDIYNLTQKSPILQSITKAIKGYASNFTLMEENEQLEETIDKCIGDYIVYGGFACFMVRKFGKLNISHIPFKNLRTDKTMEHFYYNPNWNRARVNFVELPKFDKRNDKQEKSVFYYADDIIKGEKVYPVPTYSGALLDIMTDCAVSEFWNSSINNNFNPSAFITLCNGVPSSDVQEEIERKIGKKFTGTKNAGRFVLSFADNKDQAVDIQRIASDDFDSRYQSLTTTIQNRIYCAFRISPILCGLSVNTGFQRQEYSDAYELFYISVIVPLQKTISKQFKKIGVDIEFKKLEVYKDGGTGVSDATEMVEGE